MNSKLTRRLGGDDARAFVTTRWTLVIRAGDHESPAAQEALQTLCQTYWYPLYAYLRRKGHPPANAEDLVQGLFAQLLRRKALQTVTQAKGRFRSFLLASLNHYVSDERDREQAARRGGCAIKVSLDAVQAEERYALEPIERLTPRELYDRRWALTVIEEVLDRLEEDYVGRGRADFFQSAKGLIHGDDGQPSYAQRAADLGMSEGAFKMAVQRMRTRFRALLLETVSQTVAAIGDAPEELRELLTAVGR